jgi:hypothetical protein
MYARAFVSRIVLRKFKDDLEGPCFVDLLSILQHSVTEQGFVGDVYPKQAHALGLEQLTIVAWSVGAGREIKIIISSAPKFQNGLGCAKARLPRPAPPPLFTTRILNRAAPMEAPAPKKSLKRDRDMDQ